MGQITVTSVIKVVGEKIPLPHPNLLGTFFSI